MAIIKEDYVSFETAKLLKEKWFKFIENKDELSEAYIHAYTKEGKEVWGCYSSDYYPCITMNMAMKWLREVHHTYIDLSPTYSEVEKTIHFIWQIFDSNYDGVGDCEIFYDKYETACEEAIKYCLENLI